MAYFNSKRAMLIGLTGGATAHTYTATIPTESWSYGPGGYTANISIEGIASTDSIIVDAIIGTRLAIVSVADEQAAWSLVYRVVSGSGSITAYATAAPTESLLIQVMAVK